MTLFYWIPIIHGVDILSLRCDDLENVEHCSLRCLTYQRPFVTGVIGEYFDVLLYLCWTSAFCCLHTDLLLNLFPTNRAVSLKTLQMIQIWGSIVGSPENRDSSKGFFEIRAYSTVCLLVFFVNLVCTFTASCSALQIVLAIHCRRLDANKWNRYDIRTKHLSAMQCAMRGQTALWEHSIRFPQSDNQSKENIAPIPPLGASNFSAPGERPEVPHELEWHPESISPLSKQELPSGPVNSTSQYALSCKWMWTLSSSV